ncbi:MAG: PorP/SprF family type IX secretion system membrane protein [Flavobacteriales bacterium]
MMRAHTYLHRQLASLIEKPMLALLVVMLSLVANQATSQQDPKFNQYMFNPLGINPAYAGSREALSAVSMFRNQWVGFQGAPITQTFAIHGPLVKRKMGLGFQVTNDIIGPKNVINAEVDYAYRFPFLRKNWHLDSRWCLYIFPWDKSITVTTMISFPQIVFLAVRSSSDFEGAYWNNNKMYFGLELTPHGEPRINISTRHKPIGSIEW